MPPVDPDALVDAALKRLPAPRAPLTLLPRVLAAVRLQLQQPWYRRAWLTWPLGWQAASLATLALVVALGALLEPLARAALADAAVDASLARLAPVTEVAQQVERSARDAGAASSAVWAVWRIVMLPGMVYAYGLLVLMCAACAGFASMLTNVTLGRTSPR